MSHYLIRATVIPSVVEMIEKQYKLTEKQALHNFYTSATASSLSDDSSGLYGQSALFIFSLYENEKK
ncbi:MAG: hypothetical protein WCQ67_07425 [Treponema sp.]